MAFIKIPTITDTLHALKDVVNRYPFVVLSAIVATIALCYNVELTYKDDDTRQWLERVIMTSILGISSFTAIRLGLAGFGILFTWLSRFCMTALLVLYFFTLSDNVNEVDYVRYSLFLLTSHLFVAFSSFLNDNGVNSFWQFNKYLFLRILSAILFTGVLYGGLALALAAVENLFDIELDSNIYAQLFFVLGGVFQTLFFLGGIPEAPLTLENDKSYPKGLSVFTQYILVPLVILYSAILYLYTLKIIIAWDWPRGWIGYLFIGYAISGILSYLLIYPQIFSGKRNWLKSFGRWYFISLIPLSVVLFLAIYRRASEYGITENRYFLFVVDFLIAGIASYFIFSARKHIKVVPISLAVVALMVSFGPWGAFEVASRSQVGRFEELMEQLKDTGLSFKEKKNVSSIMTYLERRGGLIKLQPYFTSNIDSLIAAKVYVKDTLLEEYGLEFIHQWETEGSHRSYFTFYLKPDLDMDISAYDRIIKVNTSSFHEPFGYSKDSLMVSVDHDKMIVDLAVEKDTVQMDLKPWLNTLRNRKDQYQLEVKHATLQKSVGKEQVKIVATDLSFSVKDEELKLETLDFYVLIGRQGQKK